MRRSRSIDVLFLLDATGSMSNVIAAAKDKILEIAEKIQHEEALELRARFIAYRCKSVLVFLQGVLSRALSEV